MTNNFRLPKPKDLYRGLMISLGWATNFTPGVEILNETIFLNTLRASGIDPDTVPEHLLYPTKGRACKDHTCWRVFLHAFRYQKDAAQHDEPNVRVRQEQRSFWCMTDWGVKYVQSLKLDEGEWGKISDLFSSRECVDTRKDPDAVNLTLQWFETEWPKMEKDVIRRLSQSKQLNRSTDMLLIEDHVHSYILRALRNNSFYKDLKAGNHIPPSKIITYILNSAYTEMRGWGKDASCVAIRGATSATHRRKCAEYNSSREEGARQAWYSNNSRPLAGTLKYSHSEDTSEIHDHFGGDLQAELCEKIAAFEGLQRISRAVGLKVRRLPERQTMEIVIQSFWDDLSVQEISNRHQIGEKEVSAVLREVRKACKSTFGSVATLMSDPTRRGIRPQHP